LYRKSGRNRTEVQPGLLFLILGALLAACTQTPTPTVTAPTQPAYPLGTIPAPATSGLPAYPLATGSPISGTPGALAACALPPDPGLEEAWLTRLGSSLGCPRKGAEEMGVAFEEFEHGFMLWRGTPPAQIYVLFTGDGGTGRWSVYPDTWQEGEPPSDPSLAAPAGLYQPARGFGKVWREQPGVREGLGWALGQERGSQGLHQPFEGGRVFIVENRRLFALVDADQTWLELPATGLLP